MTRYLFMLILLLPTLFRPAFAASVDGGLGVVVFDASGSLAGAEIFVQGVGSEVSNRHGSVLFRLPAGSHTIHISTPGFQDASIPAIAVVAGEVTEVLVTLHVDAAPVIDIEVAAHKLDRADSAPTDVPMGTIAGTLLDIESKQPVAGARIFVRGSQAQTVSDAMGRFSLDASIGTRSISIVHPDYGTQTLDDIEVGDASATELNVEMTPSGLLLDDYRVVAPRIEGGIAELTAERRDTSAVADIIGSEQISKSGDSSAASALRRVTGLTLVGGKYVYVRGMGERYSATLLNGSTLPSPEPERRVVPLDMFPVGVIESVRTQKTYSADMPGEFGGGAIGLRTRTRPESFLLKLSASLGATTGTTFERGLTYNGGSADFMGIDDGTRALPGNVRAASDRESILESDRFSARGFTPEELERFGESMPNNWSVHRRTVPPDVGLSATSGHTWTFGETPFGFLASVMYDQKWNLDKTRRTYYTMGANDSLETQHAYDFESLERNVNLSGILTLGTELFDNHELTTTTMVIRTTDDEARIYDGFNRDAATQIRVTRLRFIERMLIFQQFTGHHEIPQAAGLSLDWRYAFSMATRLEPDRRETRYDYESQSDRWRLSDRPEGNQRVFGDLEDMNHDAGLDFHMPFTIWQQLEATAHAGVNVVHRSRASDTRRYKFKHKGPLATDADILALPPEEIFVPEHIGPDGFQFEEITRPTDNYEADQLIAAGYFMIDLPLIESLSLNAGVRVEHSTQKVRTFDLFNLNAPPIEASLSDTDILPATTLTWRFFEDMQLRSGYSLTVSRPDFRELSPATFNDVTGGRQTFGNENLKRARIHNVDLRYEWYPSEQETLSLAFFYKHFMDPIETVIVPSAQQSITYANAKSADNLGVEFEIRKNFAFAHPALEDLTIAGNATYIWSRITLDENSGVQTSDKRPLQGQSPFVVNAQLGYDNMDWGTSLAIIYNVFGRRIVEVGAQGAPNVYEEPVHQLDIVASQKLGAGFALSFKAKNLLDFEVRKTQGGRPTEETHKGRSFTLGLSWTYD